MPYIEPKRRQELNYVVDYLESVRVDSNGDLNYILYTYCKRHVRPGYARLRNYCAELRACATEIERRILAPYEDQKIIDNGDIL